MCPFYFLSNNSDNALNICNTLSRFHRNNFSYTERLTLIAVNKIFSFANKKQKWKTQLLGRIEIHWTANLLCSIMRYNTELVISPLPCAVASPKALNRYLLTSVTSLSLSACICIHAVCVGVGNEYQLAMVTFLPSSEFVNLMLLITVQYMKTDENNN